jgi:hypothetical protein
MVTMTTPKPLRALWALTLASFIAALAVVAPAYAADPIKKDYCVSIQFKLNGETRQYYYQQSRQWTSSSEEANRQTPLHTDPDCKTDPDSHFFQKDGTTFFHNRTVAAENQVPIGDLDKVDGSGNITAFADMQGGKKVIPFNEPSDPGEYFTGVAPTAPEVDDGHAIGGVIDGEGNYRAPVAGGDTGVEATDPVSQLTRNHDSFQDRYAQAFAEYLWNDGEGYVGADVRGGADTVDTSVEQAKAWVGGTLNAPINDDVLALYESLKVYPAQHPDMAALYYLLGEQAAEDDAPEEIHDILAIVRGVDTSVRAGWKQMLFDCMKRYTESKANGNSDGCNKDGPIGPMTTFSPAYHLGFFTDAAVTARKIVAGEDFDLEELRRRIRDNTNDPHVPDGTDPSTRPRLPGQGYTGSFGVKELFGQWGDPNIMKFPDKDDPSKGRTVAVVMRTVIEDGRPMQQVGIYDITNPSNVYGSRFEIPNGAASHDFTLAEGGYKYKLDITPKGNDHTVALGRATEGMPAPEYSQSGRTSLMSINEMFEYRAQKVQDQGNITEINGQRFYVSGEATNFGSMLYWPADTIENRAARGPRELRPGMIANVVKKEGGLVVPVGGEASLGEVGGKWFNLKWDESKRSWSPVEGERPAPETPDGETGNGATTPATTPATGDWPEITGGSFYDELNSKLSDAAAAKARFYALAPPVQGKDLGLIFEKDLQTFFTLMRADTSILIGSGGKGHVAKQKTDNGFQYWDLRKSPKGSNLATAKTIVGNYTSETKSLSDVTDYDALVDMVVLTGASATDAARIRERAAAVVAAKGSPGPNIAGGVTDNVLHVYHIVGNVSHNVWPTSTGSTEHTFVDDEAGTAGELLPSSGAGGDASFPSEIKFNLTPSREVTAAHSPRRPPLSYARFYTHTAENSQVYYILALNIRRGTAVGDETDQRRIRGWTKSTWPGQDNITVQNVVAPGGNTANWKFSAPENYTNSKEAGVIALYDSASSVYHNNFVSVVAYWGTIANLAAAESLAGKPD